MDRPLKAPVCRAALAMLALLWLSGACGRPAAGARYPLEGQILAVQPAAQALVVKHGDIEGLMPAMTMTFPVADPALMQGRVEGELITATLEVLDGVGRLVTITHAGTAPLPAPDSNAGALAGSALAVGDVVPDAALVDQSDRRRALSEWRGHYAIVTFTYTRCPLPTFCPLMDRHFKALQAAVAADAGLAGRVRLITITLDPEFDTPAVLARHATSLGADPAVWTFLTGDRVTVDRVAARFGVSLTRPADAPGEITHSLRTAIVDREGRLRYVYSGNDWTPAAVLADLRAARLTP